MDLWRRCVSAAGVAACCACGAWGAALSVTLQNSVQMGNSATDQNGTGFTVTGLSGVVRTGDGAFAAVMDNSNRVVRFSMAVDPLSGAASVPVMSAGVSLAESRDFEGIALAPAGFGVGEVLLCDEGVAGSVLPAVSGWSLTTGARVGGDITHPVFESIRANFGFESMASGIGRTGLSEAWTANEEALTVDGPASSASAGTTVRLVMVLNGGQLIQQFAYVCDPWHGSAISGARSGLADLCLLPDGRLLALERSLAFSGSGFFRTRIYEVELAGATEVSGVASLSGAAFTPVGKTALYTGFLQNVEGLCVGPALTTAGEVSLVGVTDDGDPISTNTVYAWRLSGVGAVPCAGDLNGDGERDTADLVRFLGMFGQPAIPGVTGADLVPNGAVDTADLVFLLGRFGRACP